MRRGILPLIHMPLCLSCGLKLYQLAQDLPSLHGNGSSFSCSEEPEAERNFEQITPSPITLNFKGPF